MGRIPLRSGRRLRGCLMIGLTAGFSALILGALVLSTAPGGLAQVPRDYDLSAPAGAHFYTQADGQGGATGTGFAVSNADGIPFWDFFRAAGGVASEGYPVSHRFLWDGFVVQAFQKVVFQWRPEAKTV